jgi:hypothetical protein
MRTLLFSLLIAVTACGGGKSTPPADPVAKPADPPKTDPKPPDPKAATDASGDTELEKKGLALLQKMGDVISTNSNNCDKLATELKQFTVDNKDTFQALKDMDKTQTKEQKEAFENRHKDEFKAFEGKIMPVVQKCQGNANVMAALQEMMQ